MKLQPFLKLYLTVTFLSISRQKCRTTKLSSHVRFYNHSISYRNMYFRFLQINWTLCEEKGEINDYRENLPTRKCQYWKTWFVKTFRERREHRRPLPLFRIGLLLVGIGLGLLIGFFIVLNTYGYMRGDDYYQSRDMAELIYGSTTLLFGGIGLVSAFIIEHRIKSLQK